MKQNIGKLDKALRAILGIIGVVVYLLIPPGILTGSLLLLGAVSLLLTAMLGWCPLCALFKINTCRSRLK